jgi:hypothetical protein
LSEKSVVGQFEFGTNTPKALANFSPGLERSDNPGLAILKFLITLKGFAAGGTLTGFNPEFLFVNPRFSLRSNLGLELANAFGVLLRIFKLRHYRKSYPLEA